MTWTLTFITKYCIYGYFRAGVNFEIFVILQFLWKFSPCKSKTDRTSLGSAIKDVGALYSRTWDKKIPKEEGFLLFLSGTGRACMALSRGCLVLPFVLLFIYFSTYDVTTQSATFPATSEGCRDVKKNIIGIFLFKMPNSMGYEKNNQVPMLNSDRQISVSGDAMSHQSRLPPRLVICDIVSPSTEICQSGSNTVTWFY